MVRKTQDYIKKWKLLNPDDKIIAGLSGGADSVVLLHILHKLGYNCIAAHCNFHLRGEESDRDEKFAEEFAASLNIPFLKQDFDTLSIAKERGISIEMAARDLRYQWFTELKENQKADVIAVAHHSDDNIETLLINLIRGTGIKGLTGIQPRNEYVARPLLCLSKNEILQYAQEKNLSFVNDSSNNQDEIIRNKIRLQLIPLLETINPSVREAIIQTIDNLNEANKVYESEIEKAIQVVYNNGVISIPLLKTFPSPESILFELLKNYGFGKEVIREIYSAIDSQPGKLFYATDYYILKDRDELLLSATKGANKNKGDKFFISKNETFLEIPLKMEISIQTNDSNSDIEKKSNTACLDFDKLQFPLILRKWKTGDKFIPSGMKNFQKLSDYFSNNKFSKIQKEKTWILTSGKEIVWIVNNRIDERFKAEIFTKNCFIIKVL